MTHHHFVRSGALLQPAPSMVGPGPYYTCLVDMRQVAAFPYDYGLYFSTDHDPGAGGIWLYVANGSPTDPAVWISYDEAVQAGHFDHLDGRPAANPIFVDIVDGAGHTETPHVNVVDGAVYMTYHKDGIEDTQRTLLATSADGVRFARLHGEDDSVVLRYDPGERPGNGHTGYFRWAANPFTDIPHRFVGYSLHGGGDEYHMAVWASDDATTWQTLDVLTPIEGHAMPADRILIWHELDPASITPLGNGEYAAICGGGNRASGDVARIVELYEVYLGADGRTLTRESRKILGLGPQGADDAEELAEPTSLVIDGTRHMIYVGTRDGGQVNTVMGATGHFDADATAGEPLPTEARRRHVDDE
jgi:hypothetical protein